MITMKVRVVKTFPQVKKDFKMGHLSFEGEVLEPDGAPLAQKHNLFEGQCTAVYTNQIVRITCKHVSENVIQCNRIIPAVPKDEQSIREFLSPLIVEKKALKRIMGKYHETSIEALRKDKNAWDGCFKHPSNDKVEKVLLRFNELEAFSDLQSFLEENEIEVDCGCRLLEKFPEDTINSIIQKPYELYLHRFFRYADANSICKKYGRKEKVIHLILATVYEVIREETEEKGNICIARDAMISGTMQMLGNEYAGYLETLNWSIDNLKDEPGKIIYYDTTFGKGDFYLSAFYRFEISLANVLEQFIKSKKRINLNDMAVQNEVESYKTKNGCSLTEQQKYVVHNAICSNVSIITGGPGTGKTEIIRAIFQVCNKLSFSSTCLCAPTGKATIRISELTKAECSTIHRYLNIFTHAQTPPKYDYLIIDECSMVSFQLMEAFLKSINTDCRVILLGDDNQLPSIDPGSLLTDLKKVKSIAKLSLSEVFRQGSGSDIILLANEILNQQAIDLSKYNHTNGDVQIISVMPEVSCVDEVVKQVNILLSQGVSGKKIQVLTPSQIYSTGSQKLNVKLRDILNGNQGGSSLFGFQVGDRVMQTKNHYDKDLEDVFNGQIGTVVDVYGDGNRDHITVAFSEFEKEYTAEQADELSLAYAMTIHKSQGSEFENVILLLDSRNSKYLTRQMLYTAVTRAKRRLIIIEKDNAFIEGINNKAQNEIRRSRLSERLNLMCPKEASLKQTFLRTDSAQTTLF